MRVFFETDDDGDDGDDAFPRQTNTIFIIMSLGVIVKSLRNRFLVPISGK